MAPPPGPRRSFGLRWTTDLFGPIPVWSSEPSTSAIETISLRYVQGDGASVKFHAGGAFNKLYTVTISSSNNATKEPRSLIFRATLPVEPFYKTASEVATLRYLARRTSIPVPEVIAYDCTVENELGFEWIMMEKIEGVALGALWKGLELSTKETIVEEVGQRVKELREKCRFDALGSLYLRKDLLEEDLKKAVPTDEEEFVIGPMVTTFFFAGKRKQIIEKNLGPYRNDGEFMRALTEVELEDMKLLQQATTVDKDAEQSRPEATEQQDQPETASKKECYTKSDGGSDTDDDEDLREDAPDIEEVTEKLQALIPALFPDITPNSQFILRHHDLNHSNIMLDPRTLKITGIVDWESITTVSPWQDTYPSFLRGPDHLEQPEPLVIGDTDEFRLERWENWEKTKLREVFDRVIRGPGTTEDANSNAEVKLGFREQLDLVEFSSTMVERWIKEHEGQISAQGR